VHARCALPPIFLFTATHTTEIYTLSLHDALPILERTKMRTLCTMPSSTERTCITLAPSEASSSISSYAIRSSRRARGTTRGSERSEEHTSELQSPYDLVCRLLLEKKK